MTLQLVVTHHGSGSTKNAERYWSKLISNFRGENPDINVEVKVYPRAEIDGAVAAMAKKGEEPDLAQSTGPFAQYAAQDKLYNSTEVLSTGVQGEFIGTLADAGSIHRVQYGLPFVATTQMLFYNKDLFKKAGIEKPPRTWEDIRNAAVALDEIGVKTPYGLPLSAAEAQMETLNWMVGGGGDYASDASSYAIDSPENIRTFNWLRDELVGPGLTGNKPGETNLWDVYSQFAMGEVGMLNGSSSLAPAAEKVKLNYGTVPIPGRNEPAKGSVGVADWMLAFNRNGHQDEIRTFLNYVYKQENVVEYATQYGLLPPTAPASEAMRENPDRRAMWRFLDQLPDARYYPVRLPSWGTTMTVVRTRIGDAVAKGSNPQTVLGSIQRRANAAEAANH